MYDYTDYITFKNKSQEKLTIHARKYSLLIVAKNLMNFCLGKLKQCL